MGNRKRSWKEEKDDKEDGEEEDKHDKEGEKQIESEELEGK